LQPHRNQLRAGRAAFARLALALGLGLAGAAASEEPAAQPPSAPVELDRLLKLPPARVPASPERAGSASKGEWRTRFTSARLERDAAQNTLDATVDKMGESVTDTESWQIAPPGASAQASADAPINYSLRQQVRREREELARAERRLQDLTIEADLAGVPQDWRE
jgi:hypothetical protein